MIVLGIVLENLLLLGIFPIRDDLVELGFLPPFLAFNEPIESGQFVFRGAGEKGNHNR